MASKPTKGSGLRARQEAQRYMQKVRGWMSLTAMLFVLAVFLLHPLFLDNTLYFKITEAKQGFFVACSLLLFCMLFLLSITTPGFYQRFTWRSFLRGIRPYEWFLLAYVLVMTVSAIFADSRHIAIWGGTARNEGLLMMLLYFGACILVGRFYKPKEWMLYVLCGTAALVAAYGLCQYYGADFLGLFRAGRGGQAGGAAFRFFATMSNRNVASTYFCLAFCVSLVMFTRQTKKAHWAFLPLGLLLFYALLIGQTESGYIGLVVSIALALPFILSARQAAARFFLMIAGCLGVMWVETAIGLTDSLFISYWTFLHPYLLPAAFVLLAAAGALRVVKLPALSAKVFRICWYVLLIIMIIAFVSVLPQLAAATGNESLAQLDNILHGNLEDSYMSGRMMVWKRAVSMMPDRLLFGYGPDNFSGSFNKIHYEEVFAARQETFDKLHNEYLQVQFDNGLLGLLSLLGFYGALLFAAMRKLDTPMVLGLVTALVCHMVQAFFNFVSPFAHPVAWTLWGILGALLYQGGRGAREKEL